MPTKIIKPFFNLAGICTVALALSLGLMFFADTAFAYTTVIHYGPTDPCPTNVAPQGKYNRPVGIAGDSLDVIVDPVFNAKMKKDRSTPDLPLTPVYDLVAQVVPQFGGCYTDHPENFPTTPPATLPWKVYITIGDVDPAKNQVIVGPGTFQWKGKYVMNPDGTSDVTLPIYEWKIPGWPNGIGGEYKTEKIIAAIQGNLPVRIVVEIPQDEGSIDKVSVDIPFGLCAPVGGDGPNQVALIRGESAGLTPNEILTNSDSFWFKALNAIEPYKSNAEQFSVLADIGVYQDDWIKTVILKLQSTKNLTREIQGKMLGSNLNSSTGSCPGIHMIYNGIMSEVSNAAGIAVAGSYSGAIILGTMPSLHPYVDLHEFSHTFAGLNDEYQYKDVAQETSGLQLTNCSLNKRSEEEGYAHNYEGCSFKNLYRPSDKSIMNHLGSIPKFNVISCGYIMAAIEGGSAASHWPDCKKMSGVIVADSQGIQSQNMLAAVGASSGTTDTTLDTTQSQSFSHSYVIAESFAADGTISGDFYPAETVWDLTGQPQGTGTVLLSWQSTPLEDGGIFEIERAKMAQTMGMGTVASSSSDANVFSKIAETTADTYIDSELLPSGSYGYHVRQKFSDGSYGVYSNTLLIKTNAVGTVAVVGVGAITPTGGIGTTGTEGADTGIASSTSPTILERLRELIGGIIGGGTTPEKTATTPQSAGGFTTDVKGKTVEVGNYPDLSLAALTKNESTDTSQNCYEAANPDYMKIYWNSAKGGAAAFNRSLMVSAKCTSDRVLATFYKTQRQDDDGSSIPLVDKMKNAFKNLLKQANPILQNVQNLIAQTAPKNQDLVGLTVYIIPRAHDVPNNYPFLKNVSIQCVKDSSTNTAVPETGVGITSVKSGSIAEETNKTLEDWLQDIKNKSQEINDLIVDFKKTTGEEFAITSKNFGDVNSKILTELSDVSDKLATDYFAVLSGDLQSEYPDFYSRGVSLTFSLSVVKDSSGNLINCNKNVGWVTRNAVSGDFYSSKVTVGGYSYPACLPVKYILDSLTKSFGNTLASFDKLKAIYTKRSGDYKKLLQGLANNDYSCSDSTIPKTGTGGGIKLPVDRIDSTKKSLGTGVTVPVTTSPVSTSNSGLLPCGTEVYPSGSKDANGTDVSGTISNPCGFSDFIKLINNITTFLIILGAAVATLAFAYAGFLMLTASGEMGKIEEAKAIFGKVVVGFLFMLAAWLIVYAIESAFIAPSSGINSFLQPTTTISPKTTAPASSNSPAGALNVF